MQKQDKSWKYLLNKCHHQVSRAFVKSLYSRMKAKPLSYFLWGASDYSWFILDKVKIL